MILDNDLISIVVPLYNVESYLKECIDSILIQSYHTKKYKNIQFYYIKEILL